MRYASYTTVLLLCLTTYAEDDSQNEEAIAKALADRLSDSLAFQPGSTASGPPSTADPKQALDTMQTTIRGYEDGQPMWMILYSKPELNENNPLARKVAFVTGRKNHPYTNVPNVASRDTFNVKPDIPMSMLMSGIGKINVYHSADYAEAPFITQDLTTDVPVKLSWFTSPVIGSIRFCPGAVFYEESNLLGEPTLKYRCDLKAETNVCINALHELRKTQSFHFDGLIENVEFFREAQCQGPPIRFTWSATYGVVKNLPFTLRNRVKSIRLHYKPATSHFVGPKKAK